MMDAMQITTRWIGLAVLALALASPASATTEVVLINLVDTIQPASQSIIERGLADAASLGAELAVLQLDTPGGLVDTTREITKAITTSPVPVVVFVSPAGARAASAGFFLLMAADIAAMSPGTNTGAAHPVLMPMIPVQQSEPSDTMVEKVTNDAAAMLRSLVEGRKRNKELAVRAVTESLSFTAEEALKEGLIDFVVSDLDELVAELDGREITRFDGTTQLLELEGWQLVEIEPTTTEQFRSLLAKPLIALILMALAGIGIYTEITHPGGILPGVVGVIALLLFLYTTSVLPVNWLGVALIVLALGLFALEVKVASYGLLTVGGLICFVAGALMLFDTPIPDMRLSLGMVLPTAIMVAAIVAFLVSRVIKAHQQVPVTGKEGLVGEIGLALSELSSEGKVKVHGEYWDAQTLGGQTIAQGSRVRVAEVTDRRITVEPVND
ncbi:MAG: nodulation protein NfeD [bacterium]|nr:nodulation protein NfeD [bacterium]